jgi:hypothetical protein
MSGLEKATLTRLSNDKNDTEEGQPIPVQFNPASLKLTLTNNTEGGQSTGRPARQFAGNASTELAFELVFDTADEDDGSGGPRSVREKTALVEQFVISQGSGPGRKSPPRVKFHWDRLIIKGVITSVAVDFDLFAANGTPLRARVGISIREQDAKYEIGTSTETDAPEPGEGNETTPGSQGGGGDDPRADRTGTALEGESLADFAVRMGLDAGAWRGLAAGLEGTLSLSAGLEIDFSASLNVSAGVGVSVGFEADLGVSLEASLGLEASASISAGVSAGAGASASAGFALSAAGGVGAAIETVKIAKAEAAASETIRAFGAAGASASAAVPTGGTSVAVSGAAAPYAAPESRSPGRRLPTPPPPRGRRRAPPRPARPPPRARERPRPPVPRRRAWRADRPPRRRRTRRPAPTRAPPRSASASRCAPA